MSILIDKNTKILVQGATGKEGTRAVREMQKFGTKVLAGVTPGKGGTVIEDGLPIFETVAEALKNFKDINTSLVCVPSLFVLDACLESMQAGIKLINILSEKVPVSDVAKIIAYSKIYGATVVGPSSVGIFSQNKSKVGSIASFESVDKNKSFGMVGVISKSGGMASEICNILVNNNFNLSTVVGIGGDELLGSDFLSVAKLFEKDKETEAIVIFGEIGGSYEEILADAILKGEIKKPVVALIAGRFSENLLEGTTLGHAGAIVSKGRGSFASKISAFKKAKVSIAKLPEDIHLLLKKILKK